MLLPFSTLTLALALADSTPRTGRDVLRAMHDAYQGKWYRTLTFTQKTTVRRPDGKDTVTTWYESVRYSDSLGTTLRIDVGDPANGNGVLYTADTVIVMRGGKPAVARSGGNALLPLIEGVYVQAVERTARELAATNVDLDRPTVSGSWEGRPVWIVGVSSAADTLSPQFWVDVDRKVVVRAIFIPAPTAPVMDMRFEGIVPVGKGWLATRCEFFVAGVRQQAEEYQDWKADVPLAPGLFDVTTWTTAPHWANQRRER
jgi:hypothetical protein